MPILENARHEKFVQSLIAGMSQRKAYREAFPASVRWKDTTVDVNASKLFSDTKVLLRYKELQEEAQDAAIMTRKERMVALSDIAQNAEKESDMIKAIDTLNKMEGDYTSKVELSGEVKTNPYADLTTEELRRLANVPEDG
ncbi:terminase [Lactococcus garvieae]|uniref:terminase n=1 Tax=Lactococcus garvieae TaxID=1363 RepID=UPI0030D61798